MKIRNFYCVLIVTALMLLVSGCQEKQKIDEPVDKPSEPIALDSTIGQLAEVVALNPIPVRGIGLVVGLYNTGSSECPPDFRNYLHQYILTQVGQRKLVNPTMMINSHDTAVVVVEGFVPAGAVTQQPFDVSVKALGNTQTTSLKGGRLYTTELKFFGRVEDTISASKTLAVAAGPVYVDGIAEPKSDPRAGLVLGGGKSMQDYQIMLSLFTPDFNAAALVRDRINQRFGKNTANAVSDSMIYLSLPKKFNEHKERFLELVKALYVASSPSSEYARIDELVRDLQEKPNKEQYQMSLEAIGKASANKLAPLLDSSDEQVRFYAAKCLLSFGRQGGLKVLRDIAQDSSSNLRVRAINAIGQNASRHDSVALANRVVRDDDFEVALAGYKYLAAHNGISVVRIAVSEDFYIDQIIQVSKKIVYVARKDDPRMVLFGSPIDCQDDIFIESDDGNIIINALPDEHRISIMRKHPVTGELMGPLKTSFRLADVIRALGSQPDPQDNKSWVGLGVSYSEIAELLKKMCDKGAVEAEFIPGVLSPLMSGIQQ